MIGKLLGHTQVQTTARYAHLANDPVKTAAGRVSDAIGAAMSGKRIRLKHLTKVRAPRSAEDSHATLHEPPAVAAE